MPLRAAWRRLSRCASMIASNALAKPCLTIAMVSGATGVPGATVQSERLNFARMLADYFYCAAGGVRGLLDHWED